MQRWTGSWWKLPALAGAILGVGYYAPLLVPNFVAFVPLLYWLDAHPEMRAWGRLRAGFVFGLATHLITLHFMYAMLEFSWLAAVLYLAFALALAARVSLTVLLLAWLRRRTGIPWALLLPCCWLVFEWLSTFGDLRMTGDHLAHTVAGYPFLLQFADVTGHYGVGAFVLVVNALLYDATLGRRPGLRRAAGFGLAALLLVVLVYDAWAWNRSAGDGRTARVAFVQPDIPLETKRSEATELEQWERLVELTRKAGEMDPDLIVWPETARPTPIFHWLERPVTYAMSDVQQLAQEIGASFLVGAEYVQVRAADDYDLYNAAIAVDADGTLGKSWAAKVYLVPFVEATPFRKLFGRLVEGRGGEWRWLAGAFEAGPRNVVIEAGGARLGVLVCYEQLFPDLARELRNAGAELQVVITNDAWFGRTVFQRYQANVLRLRAIENRSDYVRVANTGISGFVDDRGRYHEQTGLFEQAVAVRDVRLSGTRTVYDRLGDWPVWIALIGLAATVAAALYRSEA